MFVPDLRLIFSALDLRYDVAAPMIETFPPEPAGRAAPVVSMRWQWRQSITRPIRAFQLNYVPVVMVYFAYGALGLIDVTRDLWIKESLSFTPSQLAGIGVWLTLPWTVKMVFGELVDTVPMFGSGRNTARSARSGLLTMSSMPLRITGRPRHRHAVIAHGAARAASGHAAAAPPRSAMRSRRGGLKANIGFGYGFQLRRASSSAEAYARASPGSRFPQDFEIDLL